jgi:hypothetical protein
VRYLAGASSVVGRVGNEHPAPKQRGQISRLNALPCGERPQSPTPATSASTFVTLGPKSVIVSSLAN